MLFWLTCTPSIDLIREDRAWFAHTESLKSKYADARTVDLEGWKTVWFKVFFSLNHSTTPETFFWSLQIVYLHSNIEQFIISWFFTIRFGALTKFGCHASVRCIKTGIYHEKTSVDLRLYCNNNLKNIDVAYNCCPIRWRRNLLMITSWAEKRPLFADVFET